LSKLFFISAGEESGDQHASHLMAGLKDLCPDASFIGLGRERMAAQGLESVRDMRHGSVMWAQAAGKVPEMLGLIRQCGDVFRARRPDAVIVVDYVGLNMALARKSHALGIPTVYFVSPQVWAHSSFRVRKIRKWLDRMLVIYPFEEEFYKARGVDARFVGNPLFDEFKTHPVDQTAVMRIRERFGEPLVAIAPGSRRQEISVNLRIALAAAEKIRRSIPDVKFAIACGNDAMEAHVREALNGAKTGIGICRGRLVDTASASRLLLTKSGTGSMEIAAAGTPMVVFYRIPRWGYFVTRPLMNVSCFTMINVLAGREIVPENLMRSDDSDWLADRAIEMLRDEGLRNRAVAAMKDALAGLMKPGAGLRAAQEVMDLISG